MNLNPRGRCIQRPKKKQCIQRLTAKLINSPLTSPSCQMHSRRCAELKSITLKYLREHIAVFLGRFECHQQTRLRWTASRVASACAGNRARRGQLRAGTRVRQLGDALQIAGFTHGLLQKRWWRLEQMAEAPAATHPRQSPRKLKEEEEGKKKNTKQPDCCLRLRSVNQRNET